MSKRRSLSLTFSTRLSSYEKYVKSAPATFDALIRLSLDLQKSNPGSDFFPLAYNQWDSLWVFPIAIAYGATVFGPDQKTPTLDSAAWVSAYQFLHDLRFTQKIEPDDCSYECADQKFRAGNVAFTLNGDWALNDYIAALGDNLGIAPWPALDADQKKVPAPYVVGQYLMLSASLSGDKLRTTQAFARYLATDEATALQWTVPNRRLPALKSALASDRITNDPILSRTSKVLQTAVPLPLQPEMDCSMYAVGKVIRRVMNDSMLPADAAKQAQSTAQMCITDQKTTP